MRDKANWSYNMSLTKTLLREFQGDTDPDLKDLNKVDKDNIVFAKLKRIAKKKFTDIGGGSGRHVYEFKDGRVVKVAKNPKGIGQNEVECSLGQDYYAENMVAKVYYCAENYSFLISEKAEKMSVGKFKSMVGISFNDLKEYIMWMGNQNNRILVKSQVDKELIEELHENEFIMDFSDLIRNYGLEETIMEFTRSSSWGIVNRDGENKVVIIDYGLNDEVFKNHYSGKGGRR